MKPIKVIKSKNLPVKLPLISTLVFVLCLDRYNAPEWLWGIAITLLSLMWIVSIITFFLQKDVDVFDDNNS